MNDKFLEKETDMPLSLIINQCDLDNHPNYTPIRDALKIEHLLMQQIEDIKENKYENKKAVSSNVDFCIEQTAHMFKRLTLDTAYCSYPVDEPAYKYYIPVMNRLSSLLFELIVISNQLNDK